MSPIKMEKFMLHGNRRYQNIDGTFTEEGKKRYRIADLMKEVRQKMDENIIPRKDALLAAKWWANKISRNPRHDNGANDMGNNLAGILADMMNEPVTEEQKEKFISALVERLIKVERPYQACMECDYAPNRILSESAKEAGISLNNFPWKTFMVWEYSKKCFMVKDGYRAPWVDVNEEG